MVIQTLEKYGGEAAVRAEEEAEKVTKNKLAKITRCIQYTQSILNLLDHMSF